VFEGVGITANDVHEFFGVYLENDVWHSLVVVVVHVISLDTSVVHVADDTKHDVVISKEATFFDAIKIIIIWI